MSEQNMLKPLLRFSEFESDGGWIKKTLGDLGHFTGGGTPSKSNASYWQGNIPWISSSDISEDSIHDVQITRFISEQALQDSATKLVPKNSILLVSRVGVGKLAITLDPLCTSQDFTSFTPKQDNLTFLAYYIKSKSNKLLEYSQGMGIKGFTKDDISKLNLFVPPKPKEQQKISDCLSSLDDLITAQNQKVEALKQHKKGLMQQLFPAEGETVPKLRFPEFENDVEWQFIPLNKIAKRCINKNRNEQITRVLTNSAEFGVVDQRDFFDKDIATQGNLDGYYIVEEGDYVYNPRISSHAPVGPISKNKIGLGVMSPLYTVFRFDKEQNDFYSLFFKSTGWHHYMRQASSTGARHDRMAISNEAFMDMPIPVAGNAEQQKIADFLSSIDDLITIQTQQLEAYKIHKKGLMQQLFPSLDEV